MEQEWLSFGHKFAERTGHCDGRFEDDQRAPIFIQWLDAVWQLTQQFPAAFGFSEHYLLALVDALYEGRFGTFLFNSQRERERHRSSHKTLSIWSALLPSSPNHHNDPINNPNNNPGAGPGNEGEKNPNQMQQPKFPNPYHDPNHTLCVNPFYRPQTAEVRK